jgi:hypothetical protein
MKFVAVLLLSAAPFVFLVGCLLGLTHGYEDDGRTVIIASYITLTAGIVMLLGWLADKYGPKP